MKMRVKPRDLQLRELDEKPGAEVQWFDVSAGAAHPLWDAAPAAAPAAAAAAAAAAAPSVIVDPAPSVVADLGTCAQML